MEVLAERQIPIEICISSNLRTGCCASLSDASGAAAISMPGLMITLNSDDPAMFESDLEGEYLLGAARVRLQRRASARAGGELLEASFLPPEQKVDYLRQLEAVP